MKNLKVALMIAKAPVLALTMIYCACYLLSLWWVGFKFFAYFMTPLLFWDLINRIREYHYLCWRLETSLKKKYSDEIYLRAKQSSWCTRECIKSALYSMYGKDRLVSAKIFYTTRGVRWYHIFPAQTFSLDSPFLKRSFYKNSFFFDKEKEI